MRNGLFLRTAAALALSVATFGSIDAAKAQMYGNGMMGPGMMHGQGYGPGMMGPGMMYGQGYGPGPGMMYGNGMMNPGMMYGQGYGPGMMGPGYGLGMMRGRGWFRNHANLNVSTDDAKKFFERMIVIQGNSRLKVGDVKEKDDDTIFVDIVTKDNSLVQRFLVNRRDGSYQPEEG